MSRVLIIEDEEMLRTTMVRGISKLPDIEVLDAGTLEEALKQIDRQAPQVILSDLNLPGRSGVELLGELENRKIHIPVVYITAFLNTFRTMIPMHANVKVLEKPVGLNELRSIVLKYVKEKRKTRPAPAPFSVPDYLQLAGMGRYSVSITVETGGAIAGKITVVSGEIWSAHYDDGDRNTDGKAIFRDIVFLSGTHVSCQALNGDPGKRNIYDGWESLLMDAARQRDEANLFEGEGETLPEKGETLDEGGIEKGLDALFEENEAGK